MRLALLLALGPLAAAACRPDPAPAPGPTAEVEAPAAGPSFTLATDSLVVRDPLLRYAVAVAYPQLRGSSGEPMSPALRAVNAAIRDTVAALARDFRPVAPPAGTELDYPVEVTGGVGRSYVSDHVLSALVEVEAFTGGTARNTVLLPLTFDLRTGQAVAPADLFAAGAPWADTLAGWAERTVAYRLRRAAAPGDTARAEFYPQGLDRLRAGDVAVTMGRDSLRVHVPPGQLSDAPGAFDVGVPYPAVRALARPGSVLALRASR